VTMEGEGLYVRAIGNIREGDFAGHVELMVDPSSDHYPLLQTFMAPCRQSPGYYVLSGVHTDLHAGLNR